MSNKSHDDSAACSTANYEKDIEVRHISKRKLHATVHVVVLKAFKGTEHWY